MSVSSQVSQISVIPARNVPTVSDVSCCWGDEKLSATYFVTISQSVVNVVGEL